MFLSLEFIRDYEAGPFLFLNKQRSPITDQIMWLASNRFIWIPLYIFFLWMIYRKYPKNFWMMILVCALLILVNDQLCNAFKHGIERFRPTYDPVIGQYVMTVNGYRGGKYGFYSAHAACSFAVAMFVSVLRKDAGTAFILTAFLYAVLVSYSRLYLGVHYPSDLMVGALIGTFSGWLFAEWYKRLYDYAGKRKGKQ